MPRHYATHICITTHAHGRWHLRAPGQAEPGSRQIMARLNNLLRLGAQPDPGGAVWVPVSLRLSAVCAPQLDGCWLVLSYRFHGAWKKYEKREVGAL